jgi:hypothetical protein
MGPLSTDNNAFLRIFMYSNNQSMFSVLLVDGQFVTIGF